MAHSFVFDNLKRDIYTTSYNLSELAIVLVNQSFATDSEVIRTYDTLGQLDAATYFIGGDLSTQQSVTVSDVVVSDGYHGWIVKGTSDIIWLNTTFTDVAGALIFDPSNPVDTDTNKLVCYIDFGGLKSSVNGTFTVPLTRGIIQTP